MRTTARTIALGLLAFGVLIGDARAELFSKSYTFKTNTLLQVGTEMPSGLRFDSVEFVVPKGDEADTATFSGPKAKVTISNVGKTSATVAIAIAVTDEAGRLVGVATGGTKLFPLRAGRQMSYTLDFGGVNSQLSVGTVFRISIEPKP
jgi:hypothetical protein